MKSKVSYLVLHNIRSAQNVGSLFRTADAAGISKVYLTGYTPAPLDKFNRPSKEIAKTALGAEKTMSWEKLSIEKCLSDLKKEKAQIIAIEQDKSAVDYKKVKAKFPVAFILGNEVDGLEKEILDMSDVIAEIPMRGNLARNRPKDDVGKESLNVSVAGGVAIFKILNI